MSKVAEILEAIDENQIQQALDLVNSSDETELEAIIQAVNPSQCGVVQLVLVIANARLDTFRERKKRQAADAALTKLQQENSALQAKLDKAEVEARIRDSQKRYGSNQYGGGNDGPP